MLTLLSVIPVEASSKPVTVIILSHAEKVEDSRDRGLSEAELDQAQALVKVFERAGSTKQRTEPIAGCPITCT